jgi:uncharacterized protein involved in tolerance to divalent cations
MLQICALFGHALLINARICHALLLIVGNGRHVIKLKSKGYATQLIACSWLQNYHTSVLQWQGYICNARGDVLLN